MVLEPFMKQIRPKFWRELDKLVSGMRLYPYLLDLAWFSGLLVSFMDVSCTLDLEQGFVFLLITFFCNFFDDMGLSLHEGY
jgi:hypothetical protein